MLAFSWAEVGLGERIKGNSNHPATAVLSVSYRNAVPLFWMLNSV